MSRPAHGLYSWISQRLSAIYLGSYVVIMVYAVLSLDISNFQQWKEWLARPLVGVTLAVFVLALSVHAWIGVRDIIMDYVHNLASRLVLFSAVILLLLWSAFWMLRSLVSVL